MKEKVKKILSALVYVGIYIAIQLLCYLFAFLVYAEVSEEVYFEAMPFVLLVSSIGALVACLCIFIVKKENVLSNLALDRFNPWGIIPGILVGPALAAVAVYMKCVISFPVEWMWSYDDYEFMPMMENMTILGIIFVLVIRPVAEEIIFRGLTYSKLRTSLSVVWAVLVSALLNGLMAGNPFGFIEAFLFAVIAALLFEWTKSVWVTLIFHVSYSLLDHNFDMYTKGLEGSHILWFIISLLVVVITATVLATFACTREDEWRQEISKSKEVKKTVSSPKKTVGQSVVSQKNINHGVVVEDTLNLDD